MATLEATWRAHCILPWNCRGQASARASSLRLPTRSPTVQAPVCCASASIPALSPTGLTPSLLSSTQQPRFPVCGARQKVTRRRRAEPSDAPSEEEEEWEDEVEEELPRNDGRTADAGVLPQETASPLAGALPRLTAEEADQLRAEVSRRIRQHGKEGNLAAAIEAFTEMQVEGIAPDIMAATALIDCCVRCGELGRAERAFSSLFPAPAAQARDAQGNSMGAAAGAGGTHLGRPRLQPDAVVVGVLLRAYGRRKPPQWAKIQQLLSRMEAEFGLQPSAAIFNELVDICARDNEVDRGMQILERMVQAGVEPDEYTFAAVKRRKALRSHFKKLFLA